ncbi:nucleotide-binding protein [Methanolacinia paynteri]|uniref:nucleotide-binding protein n=1 Tax=Methanolacinia paynteri TaxID=230356 RepID=UPI00064FEC45|nr:ATP-binding protein [Methanolacinia paynteri]
MKIVVASGKGGTGKSTVAANLAYSLLDRHPVTLVDCDVEVPNLHLFFDSEPETRDVFTTIPKVDTDLCTLCGDCGNFCRYGAIAVLKDRVLIFEKMCHACGGCMIVCPEKAISETPYPIGLVEDSNPLSGLRLISGFLKEGEVLAPRIIRSAKEMAEDDEIVIIDSSPGIACPVIEAMEDTDFCILVTESTPFGLHDLDLAVGVTKNLGLNTGVVINRSDGSDEEVRDYCAEADIPVLMTIPFDKEIASVQNKGGLISERMPGWKEQFACMYDECLRIGGVGI